MRNHNCRVFWLFIVAQLPNLYVELQTKWAVQGRHVGGWGCLASMAGDKYFYKRRERRFSDAPNPLQGVICEIVTMFSDSRND